MTLRIVTSFMSIVEDYDYDIKLISDKHKYLSYDMVYKDIKSPLKVSSINNQGSIYTLMKEISWTEYEKL